MAGLSERLDASERVLFHERAHPAIWVRPGTVLGIGVFALPGAGGPAAIVAIAVGAADLCGRALQASRIELLVTDRRVLARTGVFRAHDVAVGDASAVELSEHGLAKYLGFAFVRLVSPDGNTHTIGFVPDPAALRRALENDGAGTHA